MGRLPHLERLALGRSAYQPVPEESSNGSPGPPPASSSLDVTPATPITGEHQYDSKGRPVNVETDAQNARIRHASNEILALVGVVERKVHTDAKLHRKINLERSRRHRLHVKEDDRGNEWSAFADVLSWFVLWWPTALVRRIQIGIYSTDLAFADILQHEAHAMFGNGWQGILLGFLPGTGITILHKVLWQVLALVAEEGIGAIQNRIVVSNIRRRSAKIMIRSLTVFTDILLIAVDMLLLPLETYAFARQLNIAPPVPWRPLLAMHLPSFFRFTYTATYTATFASPASFLTSAAPFLIGYSFLTRDPSPEAPAFNDLTSWRLPVISEQYSKYLYDWTPGLTDPFGAILYRTWRLRTSFLNFVGWEIQEDNPPGSTNSWETDARFVHETSPDGTVKTTVFRHRSTSLARLTATWLGLRTDMFLLKILLLPFESMVMRKVLSFYLSSEMPVTTDALHAGTDGTLSGVWSLLAGKTVNRGWRPVAGRLSQLGLSMALSLGVETIFFGMVYALVRRQGIAAFGWGQCGEEGEKEEDHALAVIDDAQPMFAEP